MFKSLSLLKQLLVVILGLAIMLVAVVMPVVDSNVHDIIDDQMYEKLETSQRDNVEYDFMPSNNKEKAIYTIVYDPTENAFTFSNLHGDATTLTLLYNYLFGRDLEKIVNSRRHNTIENKGTYARETYYYRIMKVDDEYLISIMSNSYSDKLITDIRNRIIYILYAVLTIFALVLVLWVITLIRPLKKIKTYVDSIANREEATLVMDREDEIGVVGNAIVTMKDELLKQEKVKEEMIHNISHDLKTPIALIKTYGQSVKDDIYPYGDKNSSMDVILENADRLEHKVKSLLYLNRLDYLSAEESELKPFPIKDLIEHIVMQMEAMQHIHIETDLDDVSFIGNEEHWRVAIENIIDNASRYMKSVITITLKKDTLIIYNDGDPIDEGKKEDLFNPYVKGVKGQFGLGLSIVSKIATMYGYDIHAENKDVGVAFIFTKRAS
ncbi:cell wall metabolism sensor histidine kinase WalK [uncultured Catenibacterium sp.]|uniref:sensor histidine kinase n=1 Tax=uncultured Catenibacterium sp. TaxID=286142 RepID=UPI0025D13E43|nr:HAMP domain-containing sensor histidine kinase [uncultured Catenibacterium sp.]